MDLPAAAARYLQGFQRRADDAAQAYERGIEQAEQGRMSQGDLAKLRRNAEQANQDWKQAIDRVSLDARELKFRLEQSR